MSLGSILREARERKGLTITQVAEQTHMIHQLVEEIENDDFHRITAPLYGRGFIKLFAECVEEDPAPLMQEFTEIYTGLRRPGVRTRPVQTPVESPEVAEPKDRNAPPPRPKVRHVVVADDPEEAPAAPAVVSPKDTERDAPAARSVGRFVETAIPAASEPAETQKSEVASPADAEKDAPTARPFEPAAEPAPVESPKVTGSAGNLTAADGDGADATQGEGPASSGPTGGTGNGEQGTEDDHQSDEPKSRLTDESADDESLLGDLFDLVARKRLQRPDEPSSDKHEVKDESSVKISLPAPSWDDAPLEEEGDFWQKLCNLGKWKYWKVGAALAGLFLLSVIIFAVVANRHAKPNDGTDTPAVTQAEPDADSVREPAPKPASETQTTRNAEPETRNAEPETTSEEAATTASSDGRTVYTANLIPPPDSYVE